MGALLVLPEGGSCEDLKNRLPFRMHALQHGLEWYKFAREIGGRDCSDDSLYLVTGHDKVRSWGLTSFSASPGMGIVLLRLGISDTSQWKSFGCARFRRSDETRHPKTLNQSVFLRGYLISVRSFLPALLFGEKVRVEDSNGSKISRSTQTFISTAISEQNTSAAGTFLGGIQNLVGNWSTMSGDIEVAGRIQDSAITIPEIQHAIDVEQAPALCKVRKSSNNTNRGTTVICFFKFRYPSAIINQWLLREVCPYLKDFNGTVT